MKPSTELFDLIRTLTKSEKRFFKLSSSLQSGEKNYIKIFDAIDEQAEYDEEALKDIFKDESFVQHFPSEKNHLYKLILKSLRSYHADNSISSILQQEIKNIEILYKKALYKECNKFLLRAKKMAHEHEKFYYLFELINIEKQLLEEAYESGEFGHDLDALIKEENEILEKLRNLAEYHILYSKINYVFRREGFAHNEEERKIVSEIENYHLIKGKNTALSSSAASICYYIKGLCATTNRQYLDAYTFFNRVKEILDKNPNLRTELAKRYVRTLSHLLYCYIDSEKYTEAYGVIEEMHQLEGKNGFNNTDVEVSIFTSTHLAELLLWQKKGEHKQALLKLNTIISGFSRMGETINKENKLLFNYQIACIYFGAGEYKDALQWLNHVLNDNEQSLRQDIYSFARLLNLIVHYELGNYDLLEYIIKSTLRFLNKKEKDYKIESVLIKHLRKLVKINMEMERRTAFQKMKAELEELFENPVERVLLDYFDVMAWIDAKIQNISFTDAVKKRSDQEKK